MKAMRKVVRGAGFRGALNYVFDRAADDRAKGAKPGKLIGGNMIGTDPRSLAAEFKLSRELRPDILKPVWHQALRLPAGDRVPEALWVAINDYYMSRMGFTEQNQRAYVLHDDEEGQHPHIVASRIGLDGSVWKGRDENLLTTKIVAEIEKKFGLRVTVTAPVDDRTGLPDVRSKKKKLKKGEIELSARTGIVPPRAAIQSAIDVSVSQRPRNLSAFEALLAARGVTLHVNKHPETGAPRGLSFEKDGIRFSGSQLGENYKFKSLERRLSNAPTAASRPLAPVKKEIQMQKPTPTDGITGFSMPGFQIPGASIPPTLDGKLRADANANAAMLRDYGRSYDLYWPDTSKPSFRWCPDQNRILSLANPPNEQAVRALFDLAREKGLGMPQITIIGTPTFQALAAREAAARGIPVDRSKLCSAAADMYESTFSRSHGDAANAIVSTAYESADTFDEQVRKARLELAAKNAKNDDDQNERARTGQKMRG